MRTTTLCYLTKQGKTLLLHRVGTKKQENGDPNAGKWIGIGGGVEEGETPAQAAVREMQEETGLTPKNLIYRGVIEFLPDVWEDEVMHLFTATDCEGEMIACSEGTLAWIDAAEIPALPAWEGDRIFLDIIFSGQDRPFFTLTLYYVGDTLSRAVLDGRELTKTEEGWV